MEPSTTVLAELAAAMGFDKGDEAADRFSRPLDLAAGNARIELYPGAEGFWLRIVSAPPLCARSGETCLRLLEANLFAQCGGTFALDDVGNVLAVRRVRLYPASRASELRELASRFSAEVCSFLTELYRDSTIDTAPRPEIFAATDVREV